MAKADKTDMSTDQNTDAAPTPAEDIVDAEIIEETTENAVDIPEALDTDEDTGNVESSNDPLEADPEASDVDGSIESEEPTEIEPAEEETVSAEMPAEPAPATEQVKKTGFLPVALGGVVAAALGFGVSQYVGPLVAQKDDAIIQLEATVQAQTAKIDELLSAQAQVSERVEGVAGSNATLSKSVDDLGQAVAEVNVRIDDASQAVVKIDGRITALEKNPITQSLPSSAIEAYERELEELKSTVTAQRNEAASMEENAKLTAQQALARAALSRVLSALDSGAIYRTALTDFSSSTGVAAPEALETFADTGIPTLANLQDSFPGAARAALATARQSEATEGNRLSSFLKAQLGARSVTAQDGNDADAVLSRAEEALRSGRVTDVLAELATLPDASKADVAGWVAHAENRQAAFAAGEVLSQQLNSN